MNHNEKQKPNWSLLWTIAGVLVALVLGFAGLLYQSGRILPQSPQSTPPVPTATLNVTPIAFDRIKCLADNSIDQNSPWRSDGQSSSGYTCDSTGFTIKQAPHSGIVAGVALSIPRPGYRPDRDYGVIVTIGELASPHSCAGVLVRWNGYRSYGVELCRDGVWAIFKTFGISGLIENQQTGTFTVTKSGSYELNVEVSDDTLSTEVEGLPLPSIAMDPTFLDGSIGLFVDGGNPRDTAIDPNANPGASATFSKFKFTPLP